MLETYKKSILDETLNECREIAAPSKLIAVCIYGVLTSRSYRKPKSLDVLAVAENFRVNVASYKRKANNVELYIIVSEREVFEKDVKTGSLGDFLSDIFLTPYIPLLNSEYLRKFEKYAKMRMLKAIIENLILEYPELCYEILIKPEYFVYELARRKVKIFPPVKHSALYFFKEILKEDGIKEVLEGFKTSLDELEKNRIVIYSNGYVRINPLFIDSFMSNAGKKKVELSLRKIQRKTLSILLDLLPEISGPFIFEDFRVKGLKNSESHLYIPTSMGLVSLADKISVKDFVSRLNLGVETLDVEFKEIGGILNSVYLLRIRFKNGHEKRMVVKKFKDWLGLKWFPVTLWALGTKSFAVLGESRLEREYAINRFLKSKGFNVPEIIYVSAKEGLIFQEHVEGFSAVKLVKQVLSERKNIPTENFDFIRKIGSEIARVHLQNVCIGDCKPENILLTSDSRIFFVDLEQASRNGDKAWDIAEFLYYSGHYALPTTPMDSVKRLAKSFIEGYLGAGGEKTVVKSAAAPKYTKVFSIFALPHVILTISNLCREMGK